jgi:hypothetical protein
MPDAKKVTTPIATHFKLSSTQCPVTDEDIESMSRDPYSSTVGSLMYAMVCSLSDLSYAMNLFNRYMDNPGKEHWKAIQWIFRYLCGISKACLKFGRDEKDLLTTWIQNMPLIWIREGPLWVMCLLLVIVL